MKRLREFFRLPSDEQWLLVKAALLLGGIKLGLRVLSFRALRGVVERLVEVPVRLRKEDQDSVQKVVWAVELASLYVPTTGTCLVRALAAQVLLARRGHPTLLHIGVARKGGEGLQAHAWLESGGKVVIGGHELGHYTPLAALKVKAPYNRLP
jgi:hypothetical protein